MFLSHVAQVLEPSIRGHIDHFLREVETELQKYTFNDLVFKEAEIRFAGPEIPEYPKLFVKLTWHQLDHSVFTFDASITLRELVRLSENDPLEREVYVYHFARMLLSNLALSQRVQ